MSEIHWYAFSFEDYATDTARLSCEGHGAYLLLMVDYYNTKTPMPDDDAQLADLVKLSPERWKAVRPSLERYFRIEAGYWYHDRIEHEIRQASSKHAASIARAKHAADVKHGRASPKDAQSTPQASPKSPKNPKHPTKDAPSVPGASPTQSSKDTHLQLHPSIREGGESAPPKQEALQGKEESKLTLVSPSFEPATTVIERCHDQGFTDAEIDTEIRKFIANHQAKESLSANWDASFATWIEREIVHRAKTPKAAPRIEVNSAPDWDMFAKMWVTLGKWPSHGAGGEPGMKSCRCPPDVLQRYGISPETGLKISARERA